MTELPNETAARRLLSPAAKGDRQAKLSRHRILRSILNQHRKQVEELTKEIDKNQTVIDKIEKQLEEGNTQ